MHVKLGALLKKKNDFEPAKRPKESGCAGKHEWLKRKTPSAREGAN
jgi:hypothetical protein